MEFCSCSQNIEKLYQKNKTKQQHIFPEGSFNPPNILSIVFWNIVSGKCFCFVFFNTELLKQKYIYLHFIRLEEDIWKPNTIYMTSYHWRWTSFFEIWMNQPLKLNQPFCWEDTTPWPLAVPPSYHDWDTLYSLYHQNHPASQPVLPFGLCHSEQPFVLSCPALLPQIEVVNTFKSGTSFQGAGALRRQSSTTSQTQDVTNVSSPSHVSLSNALSSPTSTTAATAPPTTGRESDLCQSASLLSLLQGCHPVLNKKWFFTFFLFLKQITVCYSPLFGLASLKICLFLSCYLLFFSFPLFCLYAVHTGFQIHLDISSHVWVYCPLIGECVFVSPEC